MKAFLVENEKNLREVLKKLLQIHCPEVEVVGEADSVQSALKAIPQYEFDILFLDIEMDDGTGLDLLSQLKQRSFHVIFVTAYDKYAIHAFRFSAIDYLLKPVDPDALESAIAKVKDLQQKEMETQQLNALIQNLNPPNGRKKKIVVNDKSNLFFIDLEDVYYLQARGAYTEICLKDKVIFTSKNLKNYEEILLDAGFVRTHNSYIVNLSHVVKLNKSDNLLELKNNKSVSVSARKKDVLISENEALQYVLIHSPLPAKYPGLGEIKKPARNYSPTGNLHYNFFWFREPQQTAGNAQQSIPSENGPLLPGYIALYPILFDYLSSNDRPILGHYLLLCGHI